MDHKKEKNSKDRKTLQGITSILPEQELMSALTKQSRKDPIKQIYQKYWTRFRKLPLRGSLYDKRDGIKIGLDDALDG